MITMQFPKNSRNVIGIESLTVSWLGHIIHALQKLTYMLPSVFLYNLFAVDRDMRNLSAIKTSFSLVLSFSKVKNIASSFVSWDVLFDVR